MYAVIFHPGATKDLIEAQVWYELQQEGLANKFADAVRSTIDLILSKPELFPKTKKDFRETTTPVFPYSIVYQFKKRKSLIIIAAIYHGKRNPKKKYRT